MDLLLQRGEGAWKSAYVPYQLWYEHLKICVWCNFPSSTSKRCLDQCETSLASQPALCLQFMPVYLLWHEFPPSLQAANSSERSLWHWLNWDKIKVSPLGGEEGQQDRCWSPLPSERCHLIFCWITLTSGLGSAPPGPHPECGDSSKVWDSSRV